MNEWPLIDDNDPILVAIMSCVVIPEFVPDEFDPQTPDAYMASLAGR